MALRIFFGSRLFFFGDSEELTAGFLPIAAGFLSLSNEGGVEFVEIGFGFFAGLTEEFEIGGIGDVSGGAAGIHEELFRRLALD